MSDRPQRQIPQHHTPVSSPCVRNCCLDEHDVCLGCFRNVNEIIAWGNANDAQKRQILENVAQRKHQRSNF